MESYNLKLLDYNGVTEVRKYRRSITVGRSSKRELNLQYNPFTDSYMEFAYDGITPEELKRRHDHVIESSYQRTIQNFYSLARANNWEWFGTLTFNREKVNRSDYDDIRRHLNSFLTYARQLAPDLKYLIVPEFHKDGVNYHCHGLFANMGSLNLIYWGVKDGKEIYNLKEYTKGFTTFSRVQDFKKCVSYCCKYITKDLANSLKGKRRFWSSRNLDKPIVNTMLIEDDDLLQVIDSLGDLSYAKSLDVEYLDYDSSADFSSFKINSCNIFQVDTK